MDNPENYQETAIEAAKQLLEEKQLSELELNEIRGLKSVEHSNLAGLNYRNTEGSFLDEFQVPHDDDLGTPRLWWLLGIFFTCFMLLQVAVHARSIMIMDWNNPRNFNFILLSLIPVLLLVTGVILFWLKFKLGWISIVGILSFQFFSAIYMQIINFYRPVFRSTEFGWIYKATQWFMIVLVLSLIILAHNPKIKKLYRLTRNDMIGSYVIAGIFFCLLLFTFSQYLL